MEQAEKRKAIWGWMLFDFASQPFHTLLVTFIFAPYFTSAVAADATAGQATWGFMIAAAGFVIAIMAPFLGAVADTTGPRKPWIVLFSVFYILGTVLLWQAVPQMEDVTVILLAFAIALVGVEFATTFINAMLPDLAQRDEVGEVSGTGWALGYVGGLISLFFVLLLVVENADGVTFLGNAPIGGLDPSSREGTRSVGPFSAIWYLVFMIPFFLWVPDAPRKKRDRGAVKVALSDLLATLKRLPSQPNFFRFLLASMFYRDALVGGIFAFGGIFAAGVLGWSIEQIGMFGILAAFTGAIGAWVGGRADRAFGPKPVIYVSIVILVIVSIICLFTERSAIFGIAIDPNSSLSDNMFYFCGALIGAAGGSLQAASRTMVVRLAHPERMTEAFGIYALTGKATAFITPLSIGLLTTYTGDRHTGIFAPIIVLFLIGIGFLVVTASEETWEKSHA